MKRKYLFLLVMLIAMSTALIFVACQGGVSYELTINNNREIAGTQTGAGIYAELTTVTVTATEDNEDFYFIGWYNDENNLLSNSKEYTFTMPEYDYTITAAYGPLELVLSWDAEIDEEEYYFFAAFLEYSDGGATDYPPISMFNPGHKLYVYLEYDAEIDELYTFIGFYIDGEKVTVTVYAGIDEIVEDGDVFYIRYYYFVFSMPMADTTIEARFAPVIPEPPVE